MVIHFVDILSIGSLFSSLLIILFLEGFEKWSGYDQSSRNGSGGPILTKTTTETTKRDCSSQPVILSYLQHTVIHYTSNIGTCTVCIRTYTQVHHI